MDQQLKSNLTSKKHWSRLVFMIVFAVCLQVSSVVMWALVVLQFLFALITGNDNLNLRRFGDSLSQFIYQSLQFLTYASEEKPFPFSSWPESNITEGQRAEDESVVATQEADVGEQAEVVQSQDNDGKE